MSGKNLFENRIVGYTVKKASDLTANPANWRKHPERQRKAVQASLKEIGWIAAVVENVRTGYLVDGHERVWQAMRNDEDVPVLQVDLSEEEERLALATFDPITYMAETDAQALDALLQGVSAQEEGLQALLAQLGEVAEDTLSLYDLDTTINEDETGTEPEEGDDLDDDDLDDGEPLLEVQRRDVPDAVWPSDNDYGIPLLDIRMQATAFDQPATVWGTRGGRKVRMSGTWLFYTEDYRYEALWRDPSPVVNTGAAGAVEPNFSAYSNMPVAVAMWQIYRKRWIARWWQSYGLRVWVDLNVASNHAELNRLGIPAGWRAFATRGYSSRLEDTHNEYRIACEIAGDASPLFLVYGGGQGVKDECKRMGWLWVPEDMDQAKKRTIAEV